MNYRDLFGDVLDSIEMGMREDVYAGSLREEELEVCFFFGFCVLTWCLIDGFIGVDEKIEKAKDPT